MESGETSWYRVHARDLAGEGEYIVAAESHLLAFEQVIGYCATQKAMKEVVDMPLCPSLAVEHLPGHQAYDNSSQVFLRSYRNHIPTTAVNNRASRRDTSQLSLELDWRRLAATPQS